MLAVKEAQAQGIEALKKAPITGPVPYLYLDATFLDARWARRVENVSALVAYGVGADGKRQLLGITIGATMDGPSFLRPQTLAILVLGAVAFAFSTAGGVVLAKAVIDGLRGVDAGLEAVFDTAYLNRP